ncbi:MAG: sodium:calcium antiporter, partial [Parasphingorhabdus sp.]
MLIASLTLLAGLAVLILGGELLVRGAVRVAERAGMSQMLIGLTIVGFGTSSPELVASIEAALAGSPGIAWGNVVGSNIVNSLMILGVASIIFPLAVLRGQLWRDGGLALIMTAALWYFASNGGMTAAI